MNAASSSFTGIFWTLLAAAVVVGVVLEVIGTQRYRREKRAEARIAARRARERRACERQQVQHGVDSFVALCEADAHKARLMGLRRGH